MILFGVRAQLFEGHYGIFELTLYNTVAYTNQSYCDNVPILSVVLEVLPSVPM
jgi:hypothetical protein